MATSRENYKCSLAGKHVFMQFRRIYILHSENTGCLTHFKKKKEWRPPFSLEITVFLTKNMARYPCIVSCFGCFSKTFSTFLQQERKKKMLYLKSPLFFFFFLSEFRDNIHKQAKSEKKNMMKIKRTNLMNNLNSKTEVSPT